MAEPDQTMEAPPVGEQIHMPAPSILPILNAAGLSVAIISIPLSIYGVIAGALLFLGTAAKWIASARRDMEDLPLDHHAGH